MSRVPFITWQVNAVQVTNLQLFWCVNSRLSFLLSNTVFGRLHDWASDFSTRHYQSLLVTAFQWGCQTDSHCEFPMLICNGTIIFFSKESLYQLFTASGNRAAICLVTYFSLSLKVPVCNSVLVPHLYKQQFISLLDISLQ